MSILLPLYLAVGTLLVVIAVPLRRGKVPPNPLYGFRVPATLDDPAVWYPVNRYSAAWLIATGLSLIAAAPALAIVPGISVDRYALGCLAVTLAVLIAGLVQSFRYLGRVTKGRGASDL